MTLIFGQHQTNLMLELKNVLLPTNFQNETSPEVLKYYVHEFCFIMVVLMFCLLGQQIQNEVN